MRKVFLDDFRVPKDCMNYVPMPLYMEEDWVIVRSYDEFVADVLKNGVADIYSFDHDLADEHYGHHLQLNEAVYLIYSEKTGYHCAKWLIEFCIDNKLELPKLVYIHSMNRAGAQNIKSLFETYKKVYGK